MKLVASGANYIVTFNGNIALESQAPRILADGTTLVEMLVRNYVAVAQHVIGELRVEMDDARQEAAPASTYRMSPGSMGGRHEVNMYLTLRAPGLFPGKTLRSKGLAQLSAETPTFPPVSQVYQLAAATEFEDPANPGPVLARIDSFPVLLNPDPTP
ncbi:hypothetical protein DB30_04572 [Enhygromyxa salina]|uniref:Uncharacterized protein n=1 Tax=Enhygromyxa salina TaxID=215803 RepID=A0A0C2DHD5_9BACT|nr:hypothetical protein DB30_04572 [Enhygromyxa salina]